MCNHGHWYDMNIMRHWPLNWSWPKMLNERVVFMHVLQLVTRALCAVETSGKCSFLWITGRRRMQVSPVRRKTDFHTQQQAVWKPSQAFQGLRTLWRDSGSHRHSGARGDTIQSLGWATQMISLLPSIDSRAQLGWSCAGNFVVVINSKEKASQPEVTAGASETHTLHSWAGSPE